MPILRLSVTAALCLLLAALAWQQQTRAVPEIQRANALLGERWYQLSLAGEHLGYWVTRTARNRQGQWVFESEQRSALNPDDPVTIATRRVFAAVAPFELLEAQYSQRRRRWQESTRIEQTANGYLGHRLQASARRESAPVELTWEYSLRDYLDFEVWLHDAQPAPGSLRAINALDFSRLDVVSRQLLVKDYNAVGYRIENSAPQAATSIQLDQDLAPQNVRLAGLFDLTMSDRAQALAPRSALHTASYYVPIDQALRDHTRISRLDLSVHSDLPAGDLWQDARHEGGEWILSLTANPLSRKSFGEASGSSLGYPIEDQRIVGLTASAIGDLQDAGAQLEALVSYVHDYLSYQPGSQTQSVLSLLDNPVGDCTEFAELLTTLARNIGLPARTVFGLAYADRQEPAFVFHAWNEVNVNGRWQSVDPTWNQMRVDATHIPLPVSEALALKLLTGSIDIAFELRDIAYFSD